MKRTIAIITAITLVVALMSGCMGTKKQSTKTLILGSTEFNGVFSPFFGTTAYDSEVAEMVVAGLLKVSRNGEMESALAEYKTPETITGADGSVTETVYTFKLIDKAKFSDGTKITADDIIFNYNVLCDPTYDGSQTLYTLPIFGMFEFRNDVDTATVESLKEKAKNEPYSEDDIKGFIRQQCANDYNEYGAEAINDYTGFTNPNGLSGDALKEAEIDAYLEVEVENYYDDYVAMEDGLYTFKLNKLIDEFKKANPSRPQVESISGIKKIDEKTVEVRLEGIDPAAIYKLAISVAPKAYYGKDYKKGDLKGVQALNGAPMGAGPYKFESFKDNVVSLVSNPNYYKGEPAIAKIKYQVVPEANKFENVKSGTVDISDPTASPEMVKNVQDAGLHYELIDHLGYGYIGINAELVPDKNVRKGLMSVLSNRETAVKAYYGELASVIERPISKTSWAYPENASTYYPYDIQKAKEYFEAAGYKMVESGGKRSMEKDGEQLKIEIGIPGGGTMEHPTAPILQQAKTDLETIGVILEISDVEWAVLSDRMSAKNIQMWAAAWGATIDPDMYQVYHSESPGNQYKIKNKDLDKLMIDARKTLDVEVRKELYSKCLDIIMDEAVEMPVYQRKNLFIFNPENVKVDTLPKDMSPYYGYLSEIEALEMTQ